ncbi:MAG: tRNA 2-thiocytidine(32) synthetase TtcA [Syntrophales bacterium]|nr:tRNA 2-thiocytidine(32) synthetase TtcA [Syntrophales bacterium]
MGEGGIREKGTKLYHHLKKWLERGIMDYDMVEEGDRLLVGVSGGADSMTLIDLLLTPMVFVPKFEVVVAHIDMGFENQGIAGEVIKDFLSGRCEVIIEKTDIGPYVHSEKNRKKPCFLCSRLRRRRLFEIAVANGCRKVVLAHHRDDIIETLLINLFFGREISTMMPVQSIFKGELFIIRPLVYITEELIKKYAKEKNLPVCKNLCPSVGKTKRSYVKELLNRMEIDYPLLRHNIWTALHHVKMGYISLNSNRS